MKRIPKEVFIAYSHKDAPLMSELLTHLTQLKRDKIIKVFFDGHIPPGEEWDKEIRAHLKKADIVLLLVSPDSIASDYFYGVEARTSLQRHKKGEAAVIPTLIRPVDLQGTPFKQLQVLPANARPVKEWKSRDEAWADVVRGVRMAVEKLSSSYQSQPYLRITSKDHEYFDSYQEVFERLWNEHGKEVKA